MTACPHLAKASLSELLDEQDDIASALAAAKGRALRLSQELQARFADAAKLALDQAGKTHGSITLPMQDGFALKTDTKQTVKWDSVKLQEVAQALPWDRVNALFKIAFSMSETIYKGVAALSPDLRAKIDAARTTTIGEPSITLTKDA